MAAQMTGDWDSYTASSADASTPEDHAEAQFPTEEWHQADHRGVPNVEDLHGLGVPVIVLDGGSNGGPDEIIVQGYTSR